MYIKNMGMENLIGVHISHCQRRTRRRSFYFSGHWPGWDKGSTILRILEGKAVFNVLGTSFTAGKNDIVLWDPGGLRELRPHPDSPVSYYALTFDLYAAPGEAINVSRLGLPFLLRGDQPRAVWSLLKEIHKTYNKKRRYYLEECSVLGLKLLRTLRETSVYRKEQPERPGPFVDERIRETLTYIVENYKQRLNIKALAERAGMHPVHYTRLFKRMMGMTPYQYLMERKIDKAKDFLRLYDEPPNAVYLEFGFHDYSHFYRTFKERVGMSPSQYVKRFRNV